MLVSELPPVISVPVIGIGRLRVDERLAATLVVLGESIALFGVPVAVVVRDADVDTEVRVDEGDGVLELELEFDPPPVIRVIAKAGLALPESPITRYVGV